MLVKLGTNALPKVRQADLYATFSSCHVIDKLNLIKIKIKIKFDQ